MQNQTSLQETTIKEEAEGLGIEYTNYRSQPHDTKYDLKLRFSTYRPFRTHYNLDLWTNPSPDYSLYQRDYVATGETEPVETGRSRYRIQILFVSKVKRTSKKGCVQHRLKCSADLCLHEFCLSYWWLGGQLLKCKMHRNLLLQSLQAKITSGRH